MKPVLEPHAVGRLDVPTHFRDKVFDERQVIAVLRVGRVVHADADGVRGVSAGE